MDKDLEFVRIRGEVKLSDLMTEWQDAINKEESKPNALFGGKDEKLFSQGKVFVLKEGVRFLSQLTEKRK